jgi:hypothetical protein
VSCVTQVNGARVGTCHCSKNRSDLHDEGLMP